MANLKKGNSKQINTNELSLMIDLARISADDHSWKSNLSQLATLLREFVIFDNFVLYKKLEEPDNNEVVYAKALGRGKTQGESVSWGESIINQVFSSHKVITDELVFTDFPDRLGHPYIIGIPIEIQPETIFTIILIRFGGPEFSDEDRSVIDLFVHHVKCILQKKILLDKITWLEAEHQQVALQEDFISTVSHELLSPIGFIKGYTTTLMRADTTWNVDTQKEFLQVIDEETDRLQELLDNMLDSARLQNGSMSIENQPVKIEVLLRDVVKRAIAHQSNIKIVTDLPEHLPVIRGDSRRLSQVFENLISTRIPRRQIRQIAEFR